MKKPGVKYGSSAFTLTFKHFIDVIPEVLHPPFITQVGAHDLLGDAVFCHVYHRVSILRLKEGNEAVVNAILHISRSLLRSSLMLA